MNSNQIEDISYQNMTFLNEETISKYLHCPVCKLIFNNPKRLLLCGDTFCQRCLTVKESKSRGRKPKPLCPVCSQPYNEDHIQDDLTAKKIIDDLRVQCKRTEGCKWVGILQEHRMHIQNNECIKQDENTKQSQIQSQIIVD